MAQTDQICQLSQDINIVSHPLQIAFKGWKYQ